MTYELSPGNYVTHYLANQAFSEAPPAIMDAINHITWAGKDAITDGSFKPCNELLCLAYMEDQDISVSLLVISSLKTCRC